MALPDCREKNASCCWPKEERRQCSEAVHGAVVCCSLCQCREAQVVCRMLGYAGGVPFQYGYFGWGSGKIWLEDVSTGVGLGGGALCGGWLASLAPPAEDA